MNKIKGMPFILVVLCVVFPLGKGVDTSSRTITEADAMEYLKQYNYIDSKVSKAAVPAGIVTAAISKFQKMANLPITGELNGATLRKMAQPRCGFHDVRKNGLAKFVESDAWPKNELTWKITKYSQTSKLTRPEQKDAMARAFDIWAKETPLHFTYVSSSRLPADMDIKFVSRNHGDGTDFDGPGGYNAHAFLPTVGQIHFDDEETWLLGTNAQKEGVELYIVAAHEIGHALGLYHSSVPGSLMAPIYEYSPSLTLHSDDVDGIQKLYGKSSQKRKSSWWFLRK